MVPWFDQMFGPSLDQDVPDAGSETWDFAQWQPDVLIVALGTNDSSPTYPLGPSDMQQYVTQYVGFLTSLRMGYPHTEIFCLAPFVDQYSPTGDAPWSAQYAAPWDTVRAYIGAAVTQFGDAHTHAIIPVTGTATTGYSGQWLTHDQDYVAGDTIHPNISGDTKIATHLQSIIAPIMGW
jgi:lysophospholipase L1-like esterase